MGDPFMERVAARAVGIIVAAGVLLDYQEPFVDTGFGHAECFYCGAMELEHSRHEDYCPWWRLRQLIPSTHDLEVADGQT